MTPLHDGRHNIGLRPMTQADILLGLRLTSEAGWNQTEADWQMLLAAGFGFVATYGTTSAVADAGTATIVPYGTAFSWIGMVLVDPVYRRRGVGTALLQRAIAEAMPYGCVRLDATPQGEALYTRLGFRAEYGLLRMVRQQQEMPVIADAPALGIPGDAVCRSLDPARLAELIEFDAPIFGAARGGILGAFVRNAPRYAFTCHQDDVLSGYCLGRSGAVYEQVGPVVADSAEIAQALLCRALGACGDRPVIVDVFAAKEAWVAFLQSLGFATQRPYTRMVLGCDCPAGMPERQYGIAGAEIG
jgi:GNAT superfamily N-acetyltransferase